MRRWVLRSHSSFGNRGLGCVGLTITVWIKPSVNSLTHMLPETYLLSRVAAHFFALQYFGYDTENDVRLGHLKKGDEHGRRIGPQGGRWQAF